MPYISIDYLVTDNEQKRIQRLIPELNAYGSPSSSKCEDWTEKTVLELLVTSAPDSFGVVEQQLQVFEKSFGIEN